MKFDLRFPLGAIFTIFGLELVGYGLADAPNSIRLGMNMNVSWGAALLMFGITMLAFAMSRRWRS